MATTKRQEIAKKLLADIKANKLSRESVEYLADEISNQIEGKPFRPLYIPRELSKRVLFTPIQ